LTSSGDERGSLTDSASKTTISRWAALANTDFCRHHGLATYPSARMATSAASLISARSSSVSVSTAVNRNLVEEAINAQIV
jgi:hypothetical protein